MSRVLITGMAGSGRSTVLAELGYRGHRVVDADDETRTQEVASTDAAGIEQLWREDRMSALLADDEAEIKSDRPLQRLSMLWSWSDEHDRSPDPIAQDGRQVCLVLCQQFLAHQYAAGASS